MIIVSMKCLAHCEDLQGHVLVTFKRLKLPSASHYTVTGEGWKTSESKQVICGPGITLWILVSPHCRYRQAVLLNKEPQLNT